MWRTGLQSGHAIQLKKSVNEQLVLILAYKGKAIELTIDV